MLDDGENITQPGEPQTREELAKAVTDELFRIREHRKLIAVTAYRLRNSTHFCESGLREFYSELGIPCDYGSTLKKIQAWDGKLVSGRGSRWVFATPFFLLLDESGNFDPSIYNETGLKLIVKKLQETHQEWVSEVRSRAMKAQQSGSIGLQALINAFTKTGIELPQAVTRVQVETRVVWDQATSKKNIDIDTLTNSIESVAQGWATEYGGGEVTASRPLVKITISETVK